MLKTNPESWRWDTCCCTAENHRGTVAELPLISSREEYYDGVTCKNKWPAWQSLCVLCKQTPDEAFLHMRNLYPLPSSCVPSFILCPLSTSLLHARCKELLSVPTPPTGLMSLFLGVSENAQWSLDVFIAMNSLFSSPFLQFHEQYLARQKDPSSSSMGICPLEK